MKIFVEINYDWRYLLKILMMMYNHKKWYDWFIRISFIYIVIEIIYKFKADMNRQSDYVKDPVNGGIYVGN